MSNTQNTLDISASLYTVSALQIGCNYVARLKMCASVSVFVGCWDFHALQCQPLSLCVVEVMHNS